MFEQVFICFGFFYHSLCPLCVAGRETLPHRSESDYQLFGHFQFTRYSQTTSRIQSFRMTFSVA